MGSKRFSYSVTVKNDVAYVHKYMAHFAGGQVYVETDEPGTVDDLITFTFRDKNGDSLLSASGVITGSFGKGEAAEGERPGMVVRVESADDAGYQWLRETFYAAQEQERFDTLGSVDDGPESVDEGGSESRLKKIRDDVALPEQSAVDFLEPLRRGSGGPIVGIDLGTTNSCVSAWDGDKVCIIPSPAGHYTIPSVVAFRGDDVLVGQAAMKRMITSPEETIYGSKRLLGRKFRSELREQLQEDFNYSLVEGESKDIAVCVGDRTLDLRSISAMILTELRGYAEAFLDEPVLRAVITVPAYFNENQRFAVREAGIMAGLVVERILNEPTAAALAYGYDRAEDKTMLVYDLGGGTFDASLLHVDDNVFRVLATSGDTFLGGIDFDNEILDYLLEQFFDDIGKEVELSSVELQRLAYASREAKHKLSVSNSAEVILPLFARVDNQYRTLEVEITREKYDQLAGFLVDKTLEICMELLASQRMEKEDLDVVLLVGGQSRMPLVHRRIEEKLGTSPSKNVNPDEAVGLGAGLYANLDSEPEKVTLQDVLPIAIGVGLPGNRFQAVLKANTPIPTTRTIPLGTVRDDQERIEFEVFQGEGDALDENEYLGTFVIDEIPPGAKGTQSFGVEFALNAECLLVLTAWNYTSGQVYEKTLTTPQTPEAVLQRLKLKEVGEAAFSIVSARIEEVVTPGFWHRVGAWFKLVFGKDDKKRSS